MRAAKTLAVLLMLLCVSALFWLTQPIGATFVNSPVGTGANGCGGRLTLTSQTPVTTVDVLGATSIYFTAFRGTTCAVWPGADISSDPFNNSSWVTLPLTEISGTIPATTNQMYDVFVHQASTTLALDFVAWTNDTTRSVALDPWYGVYVRDADTADRYVGSFRTTGVSGQTEDSLVKRFVWNAYNRVRRPMVKLEATDTWTYTTATWRQANGSAENQLAMVIGLNEDPVDITLQAHASNSNAGVQMSNAIKEDSTSTPNFPWASIIGTNFSPVADYVVPIPAHILRYAGVGYHFFAWLEYSVATGTTTWIGDNGGATSGPSSGLVGWIED